MIVSVVYISYLVGKYKKNDKVILNYSFLLIMIKWISGFLSEWVYMVLKFFNINSYLFFIFSF